MHATSDWQRVMFTAECDPEGTGWCQVRNCDVATCTCYGPTQEGMEYREGEDGVLYARPLDYQKRVREYQEAAERAFVLSMALEKVLPFVGKTPVIKTEREDMAAAVSYALKLLEHGYKED